MRKSPEIGSGHHTTYFRELDGRMGRWWSADPITFPHQSPYNTFDGNPIYYTDASGASVSYPKKEKEESYKATVSTEISSTSFARSYVAEVAAGGDPPRGWWGELGYELSKPFRALATGAHIFVAGVAKIPQYARGDFSGGAPKYYDYINEKVVQGGTAESEETLHEMSWVAIEEGAFAVVGGVAGKALNVGGKVLLKAVMRRGMPEVIMDEVVITAKRIIPVIPCGCFTGSTLIKTEKGYKNISEIAVGDYVWAFDDSSRVEALKQVTAVENYQRDSLLHIYIAGEQIETTTDHPFYSNSVWVRAGNLNSGDSLYLYGHSQKVIDSIVVEEGAFEVYNFTVEGFHTYYVSDLEVLVHNSDCEENAIKRLTKNDWNHIMKGSKKKASKLSQGYKDHGWKKLFSNPTEKEVGRVLIETLEKGARISSELVQSEAGDFMKHTKVFVHKGLKVAVQYRYVQLEGKNKKQLQIINAWVMDSALK